VKRIRLLILGLLIGLPAFAADAGPTDAVKESVGRMIAVLKDPGFQPAAKKDEQRAAMWEVVRSIFNFREISRRTLARNWTLFSGGQQQEFMDVFSQFLGDVYLDRIQGEYRNETVLYLGERKLSDARAAVETRIRRQNGTEIPVNYHMMRAGESWKVYDVTIEGVSLVQNYRSQFNEFLVNKKPDQLIDHLKKKNEGK
jgi:phospholipid transport system substrate-binding protein